MRKFIVLTTSFAFLGILFLVFIKTVTYHLVPIELPGTKSVLIVGDSHTECAINDRMLSNAVNLSKSGSCYFYSYIKVREAIKNSRQIDTIILGCSYGEILKGRDDWFYGNDSRELRVKVRSLFYLFTMKDFVDILKANPKKVIATLPESITFNVGHIYKKVTGQRNADIGGYWYLKRNKLKEAKKRIETLSATSVKHEYSEIQRKYLLKIYELCLENGIRLVLMNTPIHPDLYALYHDKDEYYYSFIEDNMPEAVVANHASVIIPDEGYGDLQHLNHIGAEMFTRFLSTQMLSQEPP
jgi:hypothetical protein